jgi:hypothetical protein
MVEYPYRAPRKNIFLAAEIEAGSLRAPVRIRNMYETGAMIEGPALPLVGHAVLLARADIRMTGIVLWSRMGRCGLRFDGLAHVADWIAGKQVSTPLGPLVGQAGVDVTQAAIRSGESLEADQLLEPLVPQPSDKDSREIQVRIADEISAVQRQIASIADKLSDDRILLARHSAQLQGLQIASEVLDHLSKVLQAPDTRLAAETVSLGALRARLLATSLF